MHVLKTLRLESYEYPKNWKIVAKEEERYLFQAEFVEKGWNSKGVHEFEFWDVENRRMPEYKRVTWIAKFFWEDNHTEYYDIWERVDVSIDPEPRFLPSQEEILAMIAEYEEKN